LEAVSANGAMVKEQVDANFLLMRPPK